MRRQFLACLPLMVLLLWQERAVCQGENDKWFFGGQAGLDFTPGAPVALAGGQLTNYEGCSSISDNAGNLLFYTNGITVWDRNHNVMPNGTGLLGHNSSSQSALIVAAPGSPSLYYVFTVDQLAGPNGLRFSVIDMTLQSGNGDVTATKNVPLHPSTSEKITAIQRCDGNVWIISHEWNSDRFFSDLLTPSGITTFVNSNAGTVHTGGIQANWNSVGYLKASQQGNRLALAVRDMELFEVFDFDISTGVISNAISLINSSWNVVYGVEFSPDGTKLYGSEILGKRIWQFDLTSGTAAGILASAVVVGVDNLYPGALQLGPDGKIYAARTISSSVSMDSIAVINNPDLPGAACGYVKNGVYLGSGGCLAGLPNCVVRLSPAPLAMSVSPNVTICAGDTVMLFASGAAAYSWTGGIVASDSSVIVSPASTTTYYITGTDDNCRSRSDSVTITIVSPVAALFSYSLLPCTGDATFRQLSPGVQGYAWNFGDGNTSVSPDPAHTFIPGLYTITLIVNPGTSCADTAVTALDVQASGGENVWLPNAFTPNGDGLNDVFVIFGETDCFSGRLLIFDRWGGLIWQTDSPTTVFWDGRYKTRPVQEGVYVWKLESDKGTRFGRVTVMN